MDVVVDGGYQRLVAEYKEALKEWTSVRAIHPPDSAEVLEATRRVEELEQRLAKKRCTAMVLYRRLDVTE
jgi:hypothetical protein